MFNGLPDEWTLPAPVSRQGFLKQGMQFMMSRIAESLPDIPTPETTDERYLRPPGAISQQAFTTTCEPFCGECRSACPRDAIFQDAFGLPYIEPESAPCVMCVDVPCTKVCPTGALLPLESPMQITLGTAVIEVTECTAFQGSGCTICHQVCPIADEALPLIEGLPQVMPEHCTGCGICVFECPSPGAMTIRPALR